MLYDVLCTVPRLMEFVYAPAGHVSVKLTKEVARVRFNLGLPATNTQSATPQKDQANAVDNGKSKKVDKGKGKMVEPEKPKKAAQFPMQTGEVFKIYDKESTPPTSTANQLKKRRRNRPRRLLGWPESSS